MNPMTPQPLHSRPATAHSPDHRPRVRCQASGVLASLVLCGFMILPGKALAEAAKPADGKYVELLVQRVSIKGDFDDTVVLTTGSEATTVPKIKDGLGIGVAFGYRSHDGLGGALSYIQSKHDTESILNGKNDAVFHQLNLDVYKSFETSLGIRPFLHAGVGLGLLAVKNSHLDLFSGAVGSAKYHGLILNLGAGVEYYFTPNLSANAKVRYRLTEFTSVNDASISDGLSGSGVDYGIGLAYTF